MVHQIYNKNRQDYTPVGQTWYRVRQEIKEMERTLAEFIAYLHTTKNTSNNTEISYQRDLKKLIRYLDGQNIHDFAEVTSLDLKGYLSELKAENLASSTISRNIASIRALFQYLFKESRVTADPSEELKPPKVEKKMPEILSVQEVNRLLKQPNINTAKGLRDCNFGITGHDMYACFCGCFFLRLAPELVYPVVLRSVLLPVCQDLHPSRSSPP